MTESSATARFEINEPHVAAETVDNEVVVVDLRSGYYYSLAGTASFVWTALALGKSVSETLLCVKSAYDRPEENLEAALTAFASQLVREGLLRPSRRTSAAGDLPVPEIRAAYQRPVLEKFTDMKEFLLVDPIHEVNVRGWPHRADDAKAPPSDQDPHGKK